MHHLRHSGVESPRIARRVSCDPRHTCAQIRLFATLKQALNHTACAAKLATTRRPPPRLRMPPKALPAKARAGPPRPSR